MIETITKTILKEFKDAENIYIFGSFSDNTFNENSDIDIAVLYKNVLDPITLFEKQMELSNILNRDIDLIDLQNVNDVFKFEIVTKGKKIQHSKFGDNFENRIWWNYLTLQDDRKEIIKDFING